MQSIHRVKTWRNWRKTIVTNLCARMNSYLDRLEKIIYPMIIFFLCQCISSCSNNCITSNICSLYVWSNGELDWKNLTYMNHFWKEERDSHHISMYVCSADINGSNFKDWMGSAWILSYSNMLSPIFSSFNRVHQRERYLFHPDRCIVML